MEREIEERFERIEAITARHAEIMARHDNALAANAETLAKHEQMMARQGELFGELAAGLGAHRLAMANLDDLMTKLAAAQIVTEQKLQGLIESLRRSGNGHN